MRAAGEEGRGRAAAGITVAQVALMAVMAVVPMAVLEAVAKEEEV